MSGNGLNTLEYAEELKRAGVPEAQAFVQARILYEIIDSNLATKRDIRELDLKIETVRKDLDLKIETVRADLKRDIKEMNFKMALASGGMVLTILSALVTLGKLGMLDPTPHRPTPIEQVRPSLQQ